VKFEERHPYVVFHDDRPGQHATMFAGGTRLEFCGNASYFSDRDRQYSWAFLGSVSATATLIFATEDREVIGNLAGEVQEAMLGEFVHREAGKPFRLKEVFARAVSWDDAPGAVAPVLSAPGPLRARKEALGLRPRPIPMPRPK